MSVYTTGISPVVIIFTGEGRPELSRWRSQQRIGVLFGQSLLSIVTLDKMFSDAYMRHLRELS